ncbi:unnamed protein product [Amoebophrya sp. A25]|nr:unnamed protein product [Amoebophrya sp. A25]|eukprot:GSA25T00021465001.1
MRTLRLDLGSLLVVCMCVKFLNLVLESSAFDNAS